MFFIGAEKNEELPNRRGFIDNFVLYPSVVEDYPTIPLNPDIQMGRFQEIILPSTVTHFSYLIKKCIFYDFLV